VIRHDSSFSTFHGVLQHCCWECSVYAIWYAIAQAIAHRAVGISVHYLGRQIPKIKYIARSTQLTFAFAGTSMRKSNKVSDF
jgi:hypothetical protein